MSHWRLKLLETIKDPEFIVIKTERLVGIRDKYPKAKHHFLVIPHAEIDNVFDPSVNRELLNEMNLLALNLIELVGQKLENFLVGFHAEPSMIRLHLHVISKDFVSPCLKNKNHWNSFNTDFLWPVSKILNDLDKFGKVQRLPVGNYESLLNTQLKCNTCCYAAKNMPDLKKHLLIHESLYL
jgi:aprataxin